jgi:hypothetical protein
MNQHIILKEEGAFLQTIREEKISDEAIIREYFQEADKLSVIPNVFESNGYIFSLYTQGDLLAAVTHVNSLPILADWVTDENGVVKVKTSDSQISVRATMNVSTGEKPWLLVIYDRSLYLIKYTDEQVYAAPLPNFYDDGRMCAGENSIQRTSFHSMVDSLVSTLKNASYNTDLLYSQDKAFLTGKLEDDGSLTHTPEEEDLADYNVAGGRLAEIYEEAIKRLSF